MYPNVHAPGGDKSAYGNRAGSSTVDHHVGLDLLGLLMETVVSRRGDSGVRVAPWRSGVPLDEARDGLVEDVGLFPMAPEARLRQQLEFGAGDE
jgi:hypothetical protein